MSSAIHSLQKAISEGNAPITQLLRQTKVIAAKLGAQDVEAWVDLELNGYPDGTQPPTYREFATQAVQIRNPIRGWEFAGHFHQKMKARQPIADIENFSKGQTLTLALTRNLPVDDGIGGSFGSHWPQRALISGASFKHIVEAVTNALLQWTIELEKRGIKGENMNFGEEEKQTAGSMVFNIGTVHGAVGNVTNSPVTFYDNKTINQLIVEKNIPKQDRRELEDIMDELKTAEPAKKKTLVARAEELIVKHKEALGATAEIIAKSVRAALESP
jgi:hypothetical protein